MTRPPSCPAQQHPVKEAARNELDSSLLATLLGSGVGGGSRSLGGTWCGARRGGRLNLDAHGKVLPINSLLLANLVLGSSGLGLSLEVLLTDDFGLGLVDLLDQDVLVLELVTLGGQVKSVVHLAVDLLLVTIAAEEATEDTQAAHPNDLLGHTSVPGTLSLTAALMATLALGLGPLLATGARVGGHVLSHDQTVLHQLPNVLTWSINDEIYN